ncbi:unnamed protein product [Acanthosepion pharaonis]|uniref:THAP-type domain-containing protein n=1 Tax=Acanthosepion pharaonis TaxID=158019 RepID=A0A812AV89_ACAPH|nr:unnamed protein product [Sepia pharaonis]
MAHHCCVPLCKNDARYDREKLLSFHSFPKDEKLRKEWTVKIRRDEGPLFRIRKHTKVCSAHFKASDFKRTLTGRRDLRKGAIPSIFKWTTKSLENHQSKTHHSLQNTNQQKVHSESKPSVFVETPTDPEYIPTTGFREQVFLLLPLLWKVRSFLLLSPVWLNHFLSAPATSKASQGHSALMSLWSCLQLNVSLTLFYSLFLTLYLFLTLSLFFFHQ